MRVNFKSPTKPQGLSISYLLFVALAPLIVLLVNHRIGLKVALFAAFASVVPAVLLIISSRRPDSGSDLDAALEKQLRRSRLMQGATGLIMLEADSLTQMVWNYDDGTMRDIDETLVQRLQSVLKRSDKVVSIRPGVYGIVLASHQGMNAESILQVAMRLQSVGKQAIRLARGEVVLTFSGGFCTSKRFNMPKSIELIEAAQCALDEARRHGPSALRSFFELSHMRNNVHSSLLSDLDAAIARDELQAYFQPQISARTGEITGFEALVRWHHPKRGLIPPMEFLPLLERSGDIAQVTQLMLSQSAQALAHWREMGVNIPKVSINFTTSDLQNLDLVGMIEFELDRYNIAPKHIGIEVLESVAAGESNGRIAQNLQKLADLGCSIDLDDFGTGYASITNINRLCVERIKIDRSFVTGILNDPEQQRLVRAILSMAEGLGLSTVAEGVESDEERALLAEMGCIHLQGFGIGRPMPLRDANEWIVSYQNYINNGQEQLVVS